MLSEIYAINNYKIELELVFNQINVKMTDTILLEKYEGYVKKLYIYIKIIIINFIYSTEMVVLEESIVFWRFV